VPQTFKPAAGIVRLAGRLTRHRSAYFETRRRLDRGEASHLLVIKPHDQLGDFLVATPTFIALRNRYPMAKITLVTREYLAPLARRQPAVDEVVVLPRGAWAFARTIDIVSLLGPKRPDAAFVLNSVSRSRTADLVAATSGAGVVFGRSRVGAGAVTHGLVGRETFYDHDIPISSMHQVDRVLEIVSLLLATAPPRMVLAGVPRPAAATQTVGFHPTAANALKCWPLESFVELAARVAATGHTPVIFDTPKEPGPAQAMRERLKAKGLHAEFVPAGPLDEFFAPVANLDLMVCNDSGVMHIAAALGVPVLSFHSLGRPEEWAPPSETAIAPHGAPTAAITVDDAERAARKLL
jgi:ADP-heptose:LPS heptosyltransferase